VVSGGRTDLILTNYELPVMASWMQLNGRRLDCNPYLSGAFEAKVRLEKLRAKKQPLQAVTKGGLSGIYHAGREGRTYVDDPKYGVPFLRSTSILAADLSQLPLLSKKQVAANPSFIIEEGWTLITRSGTIGRMAYVRPEMAGMACSEDVLRVVPDTNKIRAGYLYAYLSSRFGLPIVVSGTYGAIIQHIEPQHIADLPVPLAPTDLQAKVHNLVMESANLRSLASDSKKQIISSIEDNIGWRQSKVKINTGSILSTTLRTRLDAFYYSANVKDARTVLAKNSHSSLLQDIVENVFEPNRVARIKVEEQQLGIPFFSSSEVFRVKPSAEYAISKRTKGLSSFIVTEKDLLLPRSGQVGGLIGRAVLPLSTIIGNAASEHLIRVRCFSKEDAAYLWAIFASEPGYYAVVGTAYGSSIPSLDVNLIQKLEAPWFHSNERKQIANSVLEMTSKLDEAIKKETEAIGLIERFIGQG
jgi:type I restriction enzyme S subunit